MAAAVAVVVVAAALLKREEEEKRRELRESPLGNEENKVQVRKNGAAGDARGRKDQPKDRAS